MSDFEVYKLILFLYFVLGCGTVCWRRARRVWQCQWAGHSRQQQVCTGLLQKPHSRLSGSKVGGFGWVSFPWGWSFSPKFSFIMWRLRVANSRRARCRVLSLDMEWTRLNHCSWCVDCGAGVGRVTKYLLVHHFEEVKVYGLFYIIWDLATAVYICVGSLLVVNWK